MEQTELHVSSGRTSRCPASGRAGERRCNEQLGRTRLLGANTTEHGLRHRHRWLRVSTFRFDDAVLLRVRLLYGYGHSNEVRSDNVHRLRGHGDFDSVYSSCPILSARRQYPTDFYAGDGPPLPTFSSA
jgi:hypothetical protein